MDYSIVIPVYNSNQSLPILVEELNTVISQLNKEVEVILVDDCSPDDSWQVMVDLQSKNKHLKVLRLANNVGQWMATIAGINSSKGNAIITIDDDLEYDTNDILKLIKAYHDNDGYMVYGIPLEKKNKDLSYKLFFKLRDKALRVFFAKIKTESFKIFKREIYFNPSGEMYSNLHFEAYTKFIVAEKYVTHIDVNYRRRHWGNSNHTLLMKWKMLNRYGIEYYKSPFKYLLYVLTFLTIIVFITPHINLPNYVSFVAKFLIALSSIFIAGILGNYLSSLYFTIKGLPEYVVIEEYG